MKTIRQATLSDLGAILPVYESARRFMRMTGNMTQWADGSPAPALLEANIAEGKLHVCEEDGVLLGVFYFAREEDPTYGIIYDGAWLNSRPYAVIHRMAVAEEARGRGVAGFIFDACYEAFPNLRIDTHRDNRPMQRALEKSGFRRCGIIHLLNGEERVAFQKE